MSFPIHPNDRPDPDLGLVETACCITVLAAIVVALFVPILKAILA